MQDSLVDESGFPRNDIDVYQVRHARHQIICLQNDLKSLMKQIEQGLEIIHTEERNAPSKFSRTDSESTEEIINEQPLVPFAKINLVSSGSPADAAVRFYTINGVSVSIIILITVDKECIF